MGLPPARDASERKRYAEIAAGFDEVFSKPVQSYADAKLAELGLPNLPASFTASRVLLADAYVQPSVPEFEYDFGPPPASLHYGGALPPPPLTNMPKPDWWNNLDGSRRIVVVTQGTVANYDFGQLLEPTLEALADRDDILVLATTGGRPIEAVRSTIPKNARIADFLPFDLLHRPLIPPRRSRMHRPVQYLNNVLEQDHRTIKRRVRASQHFRSFSGT
jgi:UDP:flavonoid glycosyltransferase YjiC (YdhE family)